MLKNEEFYEEDFYEEEEPETEVAEIIEADDFLKFFTGDIDRLASECIEKFFKDKEMHYGGPIPVKMITANNYIKLVVQSDISNSVDKAYALLSDCGIDCEVKNENITSDDVRLVLQILDKCVQSNIPKCFRGGLILMYLEFCEGII